MSTTKNNTMKKLLFLFLLPIGLFGQFNLLNASKDEVEENILPFDGQFSKKTITIALRSPIDYYKYINSRRKEIHNKYIIDKLNLKITNGGFDGKGSIVVGGMSRNYATKIDSLGYKIEKYEYNNNYKRSYESFIAEANERLLDVTEIISLFQNSEHQIWENTLQKFGAEIGHLPLKNNYEESLFFLKLEHFQGVWSPYGRDFLRTYGVPFAVNENGFIKQLRELNADYILELGGYFNGKIYRAKDLALVAEFNSDLNLPLPPRPVSIEGEKKSSKQQKNYSKAFNKIRFKRYGLSKKLWDKPKKVEGIKLTRNDFISVIFDELIKSSKNIYQDLSKIKSEAYLGMPLNEFFDLCDYRAIPNPTDSSKIVDGNYNIRMSPNFFGYNTTSNNNDSFEYSKFQYMVEQYNIEGKVIDRLFVAFNRYKKRMEDGSYSQPYSAITSIERDPIFEKN
jgi:hypothetical protein